MGIEPYLLTSSVVGVLAQRLVRTICPYCKVTYAPTEAELLDMKISINDLPEKVLYKGAGCPSCFGSGFKGRYAIYELMTINTALKQQLLQSADAFQLQQVALKSGLTTLRQEGAFLVKQGLTTVKEVIRATRGCEEE